MMVSVARKSNDPALNYVADEIVKLRDKPIMHIDDWARIHDLKQRLERAVPESVRGQMQ